MIKKTLKKLDNPNKTDKIVKEQGLDIETFYSGLRTVGMFPPRV